VSDRLDGAILLEKASMCVSASSSDDFNSTGPGQFLRLAPLSIPVPASYERTLKYGLGPAS
jgi:hypothetical protein